MEEPAFQALSPWMGEGWGGGGEIIRNDEDLPHSPPSPQPLPPWRGGLKTTFMQNPYRTGLI